MLCLTSRPCMSSVAARAALAPAGVCVQLGRRTANLRTQQRRVQRAAAQRHSICASQAAEVGKEISRVEIPAFIPRSDLVDQLTRWAMMEAGEDGFVNFGLPMRVRLTNDDEGEQNGFVVDFVREGVTATSIGVQFDVENTTKHEWVGRGADGFPVLEGKQKSIKGKHLIVRKLDDNSVDELLRASIRSFCESLVSAINKYYAFGSCFSEEL